MLNDDDLNEILASVNLDEKYEPPFERTELGNAKLYAELFGSQFKYVPEIAKWLRWNGTRWQPDDDGAYIRNIYDLLMHIQVEVTICSKQAQLLQIKCLENENDEALSQRANELQEIAKALWKWYFASQSNQRIKNTIELARHQEGVTLSIKTFDSKGHYLGVGNGVIDLRSGEFITGDEKYLMAKQTQVEYEAGAICPSWKKFILIIMQGNQEMVGFLKRLIGQGLLGTPGKDKLAIFCGCGANGKSTFVDTINHILGDYSAVTDPKVILEGKQNAEYYLACLKGVRSVFMSETKKGATVAEDLVKMIVDSGEITGRFPHGRVFQFQPVFTAILSTNHKPRIGTDHAIWRRILLVPFNHVIPDAKRNPAFRSKVLMPEAAGILNWCIEGCLEYQQVGLNPPDEIIAATAGYRDEQDKLGQFLEQCCEVDLNNGKLRTEITVLRQIYEKWCAEEGLQAEGGVSLRQEFINRGHQVKKGGNGRITVYGLQVYGNASSWVELAVKLKKRRAGHLHSVD